MGLSADLTTLFSSECDLFQEKLKISSNIFENQVNKFSRIGLG